MTAKHVIRHNHRGIIRIGIGHGNTQSRIELGVFLIRGFDLPIDRRHGKRLQRDARIRARARPGRQHFLCDFSNIVRCEHSDNNQFPVDAP